MTSALSGKSVQSNHGGGKPPFNARVMFIPKVDTLQDPGDFRPIFIRAIRTRALHKILAWRMRETLQFSPWQHSFLRRDGCLEARSLLHALLKRAQDETRPLADLFLDLTNAFDNVSHCETLVGSRFSSQAQGGPCGFPLVRPAPGKVAGGELDWGGTPVKR